MTPRWPSQDLPLQGEAYSAHRCGIVGVSAVGGSLHNAPHVRRAELCSAAGERRRCPEKAGRNASDIIHFILKEDMDTRD